MAAAFLLLMLSGVAQAFLAPMATTSRSVLERCCVGGEYMLVHGALNDLTGRAPLSPLECTHALNRLIDRFLTFPAPACMHRAMLVPSRRAAVLAMQAAPAGK